MQMMGFNVAFNVYIKEEDKLAKFGGQKLRSSNTLKIKERTSSMDMTAAETN